MDKTKVKVEKKAAQMTCQSFAGCVEVGFIITTLIIAIYIASWQ
jgi:hypothetical protein